MFHKNHRKVLFLCSLGLLLQTSSPVQAASFQTPNEITFKANLEPTPPTDPISPDPNQPVKPQNPDGSKPAPGTDGPLSLDFVSVFDFGQHPISNQDQIYYAKAQRYFGSEKTTPDYLQLSDHRGTLAGWSLRVKQNQALTNPKAKRYKVLNGATLSLQDAELLALSDADPPEIAEKIELTPGSEQRLATAKTGSGAGTWLIRWGSAQQLFEENQDTFTKSIQLFIPGKTGKAAGNYSTSFTWSLSNLPT